MTQDELKRAVARDAIKHVVEDAVIGVGSGSTANFFIDELAKIKGRIKGAVASSVRTAERLKSYGIPVLELTAVEAKINNIVGVVTNGLFADRGADVILVGSDSGVSALDAHKF